ncbi:CU044_2847 family protein [Micromonospora sp. NPDC049374]|uniref:CU044_2847 family protein n=1 Tax=Micromonospora sp. NPDC049374 TaxID=3154352 RepID=UPI003440619A
MVPPDLIEVPTDGGRSVLVEIRRPDSDALVPASRPGHMVKRASETLDAVLATVHPVVGSLAKWARASGPDQVEVEFGLSLTGGSSVIVTSGTAAVNFLVRVTWTGGRENKTLS